MTFNERLRLYEEAKKQLPVFLTSKEYEIAITELKEKYKI